MEDEAEIYDGIRAQFPLTFGKQSKAQTSLEAIHNTTRRNTSATVSEKSSSAQDNNGLPSISSSSKAWLNSLRTSKNPNTHVSGDSGPSGITRDVDDGPRIGPPRPPTELKLKDDSDDNDDDDAMVGPPPPPPRGEGSDDDEDDDGEMIGPPRPPPSSNLDDSDVEEEEYEENRYRIPQSNEIVLKGHTKVVSALAVDHTGSRVLSGSYDYTVRMYDFQGMNSRLQSFRQLEPFEGHQIRNLSWSPSADRFLCVTGSAQAKIYDRDGLTLGEFMKGDMYIRDLKNTKGHISGLTCGEWHPKNKETILTSSEDGSLRIWDVNDFKSQKQVIKPKLARPGRIPVTTCAWDREGKSIVGGMGDGSIQIWNLKPGWGSRPDIHVESSHSDDITALKFSSDGTILLSRSLDGSLKVWDLRQIKKPLKVFDDLPNNYAQTNIAFSPDEQLFLTGTSVEKESQTGGLLCLYDRTKLELVSRVGISTTSVVQCAWHSKLNQIFATTGDKSQGGTHILYDPTLSERGALVCVARSMFAGCSTLLKAGTFLVSKGLSTSILTPESSNAKPVVSEERKIGLLQDLMIPVTNFQNEDKGFMVLAGDVFDVPIRKDIIHRVVRWQLAKRQQGTHSTKTISEVSGTGRKPWRQKGTGRARHGTLRGPQFRGGAVMHGPKPRSHAFKLNKKVRRLGLKIALTARAAEGKLLIFDNLDVATHKTKYMVNYVNEMENTKKVLLVDGGPIDEKLKLATQNLHYVNVLPSIGLNVYSILLHDTLVMSRDAVERIVTRMHTPINR